MALAAIVASLWGLAHGYSGLSRDGELYAMQAYARLHPQLSSDLYLAYTSQDAFTLFSPLYALLIRVGGLIAASTLLFSACALTLFVATWRLMRSLSDAKTAWLAIGLLACVTAPYGAYRIFTVVENYLTARSMAEALIVCALAAYMVQKRIIAIAIGLVALCIHPLMALPGVLVLICLSMGLAASLVGAITGVCAVAALVWAVNHGIANAHLFSPMQGDWLEVVRDRSQFLFLEHWTRDDWSREIRVLLTLVMATMVIKGTLLRRICLASGLVGAAGLAITGVTGSSEPIALLVQGQAWRWTWLASYLAVVLLAPTLRELMRVRGIGEFCAALLVGAWTSAQIDGSVLTTGAMLVYMFRDKVSSRFQDGARFAAIGVLLIFIATNFADKSHAASVASAGWWLESARALPAISLLCVVGYFALVQVLYSRPQSTQVIGIIAVACAVALLSPLAMARVGFEAVRAQSAFSDWRQVIPSKANVLMLPSRNSCGFQWFTLERPSYTCVNQSSGVVFSGQTAAEVRRRSLVLTPVMAPDFNILAHFDRNTATVSPTADEPLLGSSSLGRICQDPTLGFVIAPEKLDHPALKRFSIQDARELYLYDCGTVRSPGPTK